MKNSQHSERVSFHVSAELNYTVLQSIQFPPSLENRGKEAKKILMERTTFPS